MRVARILETSIYGPDLDALERFYVDVLGLEPVARTPGRNVALRCDPTAVLILFDAGVSGAPGGPFPPHGARGAGHVAFAVPPAELPAWRERLAAAGVAIEGEVGWSDGGTSVYVRDPAGNLVELAPPTIWGGADERAATPVAGPPAAAPAQAPAAPRPRSLLRHFIAALAYRTQKALRGAPAGFAEFRAGTHVRTPHELVWHMTGVVGYARTMLRGGAYAPPRLPTFEAEVARFHDVLAALRDDLADPTLDARITDEQFLQGPLADAMTHAGQLALLRRLAGAPVPSEDFIFADVRADNVGADQPAPAAPDAWWRPDQPPQPPGPAPGSADPS